MVSERKLKVKRILISQPKPIGEKSPYFDLAKRFDVEIVFYPFIRIEPITAKEFRSQKINISNFSTVIFTSRHAIDHYFRILTELRIEISQETRYLCISESIALYIQKFTLFRKRKVFFGTDGTTQGMLELAEKHKYFDGSILYVCSENQQDSDIVNCLNASQVNYKLAYLYRTISNDISHVFERTYFDIICLFTPSGMKSLTDCFPDFEQRDIILGSFGANTLRALEIAGYSVSIKAPDVDTPNMAVAIERFLSKMLLDDNGLASEKLSNLITK